MTTNPEAVPSEAFEDWASEEGINNFHFNHCWAAWQAALASTALQADAPRADDARKAVAKSVFGGINALRWLLNITTEFDRKDVRTRQAARLLDEYCSGNGTSNRAHLEQLWKTLNDALSLADTLEYLAATALPAAAEQPLTRRAAYVFRDTGPLETGDAL